MKRIFTITFLLYIVSTNALCLQDTISFIVPNDLFNLYVPQYCNDNISMGILETVIWGLSLYSGHGQEFYTPEDIQVKGIAISAVRWGKQSIRQDTLVDYALTLSLLKFDDDTNAIYHAQAPYNTTHTFPSDSIFVIYDSIRADTIVLHKIFFDSSITVSDTFYCVVDALLDKDDSAFFDNLNYRTKTISFCTMSTIDLLPDVPYGARILHLTNPSDSGNEWRFFLGSESCKGGTFIFPILDLGDSTGVAEADAVGRNAAVWPNPARGTVSVASGFGLRSVDVFDIEGRLVLSRKVSGISADIDISALPRGAYMVRITTLVGTTTKKLLVE